MAEMDRPAYELVRLLEALLDDGDQVTDSPERPNAVNIWAVREVLEGFGGKRHRWSHKRCEACGHSVGFHYDDGGCPLDCECQLTRCEVETGERDEDLDESIRQALMEDHLAAPTHDRAVEREEETDRG